MNHLHKFTIKDFIHSLLAVFKSTSDMNVQLSSKGSKLLNDKKLAADFINKIIIEHKKVDAGEGVSIVDEQSKKIITIKSVDIQVDEKRFD